jgi:cytochrome c-type protein NapC
LAAYDARAVLPHGPAKTMLNPLILVGLAVALGVVVLLWFGRPQLILSRWGRIALLVGVGLFPTGMSAVSISAGVRESSRTRFCLQCHEMAPHGRSLFFDDRRSLPAVHYQNRLISREDTCYSCHTDYAMFGDIKAKLNGLRHVYVHYLGQVPQKIALYKPYPNSNCLHCHDDSRSFLEAAAHQPVLGEIQAGRTSCLNCHNVAHAPQAGGGERLWQAR